jgi:hypothetical protein
VVIINPVSLDEQWGEHLMPLAPMISSATAAGFGYCLKKKKPETGFPASGFEFCSGTL